MVLKPFAAEGPRLCAWCDRILLRWESTQYAGKWWCPVHLPLRLRLKRWLSGRIRRLPGC